MKLSYIIRTVNIILIVFLFTSSTCGLDKEDEEGICEQSQMEKVNLNIQPKLNVSASSLPEDRILKEAELLTFTGTIKKYHCLGNWSEPYSYNSTHDPRAIDMENWSAGFFVGTVYGFDFDNTYDYVLIDYQLIAKFPDGAKFAIELSQSGFYWLQDENDPRRILWDINVQKHYVMCFTLESYTWFPYFGN
jgi:hypothetical protein